MNYRGVTVRAVAVAVAALVPVGTASADVPPPAVGTGCARELDGAMTLLPDQTTYVTCQQAGAVLSWTPVQTPFPPNDIWLSYGPAITLHGQGMRNPNLAAGEWTATPQDADAACTVTQTDVVEAGVLAQPQVTRGEQGKPLTVRMDTKLFYVELAGNCLWVKN